MDESRRPILCWETRAVQEGTSANAEFIILYLNCTILRWTIHAHRLQSVTKLLENKVPKCEARCELAILVRADASTIHMTM
jgi:hypothetical protein